MSRKQRLQPGRLGRRQGAAREADQRHAGRQHEALLRAGHGHVYLPLVHAEINAGDGADAVDHQQRRVLGPVHGAAQACDVAGDAGRGFVVAGQYRLDLMFLVAPQDLLELLDRHAFAPGRLHQFHVHAHALGQVRPQMGELPETGGQDAVARRQGVGQRHFPAGRAGGGEGEARAGAGLEDLVEVAQQGFDQLGEVRRPMVLHRDGHGVLDGDRNVRGSWCVEVVAAREDKFFGGHRKILFVDKTDARRTSRPGVRYKKTAAAATGAGGLKKHPSPAR